MADFVKTSQVKLNPANPRIIRDEKYRKLLQSVAQFPAMLDVRGIVVDAQNMILGGNQRWRAILDLLKMPEQELRQACGDNQAAMTLWEVIREKKAVPANWILDASQFTEDEIRRFIIADNVEFGEHDWDALANEWDADELADWGVEVPADFGAGDGGEAQDDGFEMPDEVQTDIQPGDLFEIGPHRLLCGDSTKADDVEVLMAAQKADMVFTDPPYGMDFKGKTFGKVGIKNDKESEFEEVLLGAVKNILLFSKNAVCAICFSTSRLDRFFDATKGLTFKRILIIYKPNGMAFPWRGWILTSEVIAIFENGNGGYIEENHKHDVYTFDYSERPDKSIDHPTVKPISIVSDVISKTISTIIYDPFLGSGTTMVAAHQLGRRCYGMEIDPKYCQVIVDRMMALDPTLEVMRNGVAYKNNE